MVFDDTDHVLLDVLNLLQIPFYLFSIGQAQETEHRSIHHPLLSCPGVGYGSKNERLFDLEVFGCQVQILFHEVYQFSVFNLDEFTIAWVEVDGDVLVFVANIALTFKRQSPLLRTLSVVKVILMLVLVKT
jgi:hypothetical protein